MTSSESLQSPIQPALLIPLNPEQQEESKVAPQVLQTPLVMSKIKETIRVSLTGNLDSGKTTLSKLLAAPAGVKDDGLGTLRNKVLH